jgi:hypothetical protein
LASEADALEVVLLAASTPLRAETVVVLLDDTHAGTTCFVVSGTDDPDDVVDVARFVSELAERSDAVHAVVLASMRPTPLPAEPARSDLDRWLELLDAFDEVGVELIDWFTIGDDVTSLRRAVGMPLLWRRGPA